MKTDKFIRLKKTEAAIKEACRKATKEASDQGMERFGYIVTWRDNKAVKLYKDGTIEDIENDYQAPLKDLIKKWRSDQPSTPGGIEARAFAKAYKNKKTK